MQIEQTARDIGERKGARFLVTQLMKAAPAATVAQRLPLRLRHVGEALRFPEGRRGIGHPWKLQVLRADGYLDRSPPEAS